MDLAHPIASITTPLTGRVLEVLAGTTRPLSGNDVGRLVAGGSRAGVQKVLARLQEQGIVTADRRATATYFTANREHLAWPAIEQLVTIGDRLKQLLAGEIGAWPVRPIHASLYGSAARGDATVHSDIDVLLIRPEGLARDDAAAWDMQVDGLHDMVRRMTGNTLQTFTVTPTRLAEHRRARDPLVEAWLRDSITLQGRPIAAVIASLS